MRIVRLKWLLKGGKTIAPGYGQQTYQDGRKLWQAVVVHKYPLVLFTIWDLHQKLSSIVQELLWQALLLLLHCLLGSVRTHLVSWSLYFNGRWQTSLNPVTLFLHCEWNSPLSYFWKNNTDAQRFCVNENIFLRFLFHILNLIRTCSKEHKA